MPTSKLLLRLQSIVADSRGSDGRTILNFGLSFL